MPNTSVTSTIARQWELLRLLGRRSPGQTSRQLRDRLIHEKRFPEDLSERTVQRDLSLLYEIFEFEIVCNDQSKPFGWYWAKHADGPFPGMEMSDAFTFGILDDLLKQLVPPEWQEVMEQRIRQANAKLGALSGNSFAQWRDLVRYVPPGLPFPPPTLADGVLEAVQDALLRKRKLRVAYRGVGKQQAGERVLDPLAFIQLGERSYLVAGDAKFPEPKSFAVHRIEEAEVLDEKIQEWHGFSLDEYLQKGNAQFGAGNPICLRARIHDRLKLHFEESPIAEDQKLSENNGEWTVSATVRDTLQLEFWILSWSIYIEVLEPAELRKRIQSRFNDALDGYGGG